MTDLWRTKLRSRKPSVRDDPNGYARQVAYCLERNVIGVGWGVDLLSDAPLDDVLRAVRAKYPDDTVAPSIIQSFAEKALVGEFVWTWDTEGHYLLARFTGPWRYDSSDDASEVDIHQAREVEWLPRRLSAHETPDAVVASFVGEGQSFRRVDPERKYEQDAQKATQAIWDVGKIEADTLVRVRRRAETNLSGGDERNERRRAERDSQVLAADAPDDDLFVTEGAVRYGTHRFRERDRSIIDAKKQAVHDELGRLACEVCHYDFEQRWPDLGSGFIECHHLLPLSEGERETRIEDLALVCSNCHRMFHRTDPGTSVEQLQRMFTPM